MAGEQISNICVGVALLLASAFVVMTFDESARSIYKYYHSRRAGLIGPKWFRWKFRPSERQSKILGCLLAGVGVTCGAGFILAGAGVDRATVAGIIAPIAIAHVALYFLVVLRVPGLR